MARLAIDLPDLASSRIRPAADKWKAMGFTAPFLVQCLLAVHTGRFQMREPEKLWAGEDGKHRIVIEAYGYRWYRVGGLDYLLRRTEVDEPLHPKTG